MIKYAVIGGRNLSNNDIIGHISGSYFHSVVFVDTIYLICINYYKKHNTHISLVYNTFIEVDTEDINNYKIIKFSDTEIERIISLLNLL